MDTREPSELTPRALVVGLVVGALIGASNVVVGLKIGIVFGATLTTTVIAFAVFRAYSHWFHRGYTPKENLISATSGSAAAAMATAAGLISAVPALESMGEPLGYWELTLWAAAVASLGVFFTIPLRRSVLVAERLPFPTGTAAAETITAMFASEQDALGKARVLLFAALGSALVTLLFNLAPIGIAAFQNLGLDDFGLSDLAVAGVSLAALGLGVSFSPMVWGAGALVGPRVGFSLLGGTVIAWGVGAVLLLHLGVVVPAAPGKEYRAAFEWLMWPGVSMMVFAGLTGLVLRYRTVLRSLSSLGKRKDEGNPQDDAPDPFPAGLWWAGLGVSATLVVVMAWILFGITPWMGVLAVLLSFVVCTIAVRAVGETDVNPSGPMAKITQVAYGILDPGRMSTNLMTAAITKGGASQAADMMSDLKTGFLLKASIRRQIFSQLIGILFGVFVVVAVYKALADAYTIPGEDFGAPAVRSWLAVAKVLGGGIETMPTGALMATWIAGAAGILLTLLSRIPRMARWVPSPVALGIACLIKPYYSIGIWLGSLVAWLWGRRNPQRVERYGPSLASGLIAGEGIMMIVIAVLLILDVGWV